MARAMSTLGAAEVNTSNEPFKAEFDSYCQSHMKVHSTAVTSERAAKKDMLDNGVTPSVDVEKVIAAKMNPETGVPHNVYLGPNNQKPNELAPSK